MFNMHVGDIILATSSHTDSNYAFSAFGKTYKEILSSNTLNEIISSEAETEKIKLIKKDIETSEVFYTTSSKNEGIVEMESFSLFTNAKELGCDATTILTISDSYYEKEVLSSTEREKGVDKMILLALNSSLRI